MKRKLSYRERSEKWLRGHPYVSLVLDHGYTFLMSTISALCFAFGFVVFLDPTVQLATGETLHRIASGGMSGVSQVLTLAFELLFPSLEINESLAFSILYFVLNVPIIILAWFGIGKRFTVYTLINVASVSLFTSLLGMLPTDWLVSLITMMNANGGMLGRALFAGVCTGLSTALAFKADLSPGGLDVIAYYIALRKSTLAGKYSMILNAVVALCFFLLTSAQANWVPDDVLNAFGSMFFTALYILVTKLVVDAINVRNRKYKIEVVTDIAGLSTVLIDSLPHAATVVTGKGAFSGKEKYIITMVVSSFEVKETVEVIRNNDPKSFVQVTPLLQVYGRFFVKPVK